MPEDRGVRRHATMSDVAARAGVSRSLVSTVFRGVPGASAQTRQRILDAAQELGYRPDIRARQLRSRDSRLIGVNLTAAHPFHVAVTEELHEAAELRGYELSISLSTHARDLARAVDTLLAQRCAALLLIGPTAPDEEIARIAAIDAQMPTIVVDRHIELATIDAIRIDDLAGVRAAVDHLVALGHRRIWCADGADFVSGRPRRSAYLSSMAAHGLTDEIRVLRCGGSAMDGAAGAMQMVAGGDLPTAVVAYNDRVACGFIDVLSRHGIRVPQDVSVVGFDNIREASMPHMSITTVPQSPRDLALAAAERLVARLHGAPPGGLRFMPAGPLVVRTSTGAPRPSLRLTTLAG